MATKNREFRARLDEQVRQQLEEIRLHHYREGRLEMSMTHIVELLIKKEHKRLKL